MDNLEWMAEMEEWQQRRRPAGLDPYDWGAFRRYMINDYGRDPGIAPLPTFLEYEEDATESGQMTTDQKVEETETLAAGLEKTASE